jgi:hypothetical protein
VNINREPVRKILTEDLNIKICAKMFPKELTEEQKHGTVCEGVLPPVTFLFSRR